MSLKTRLVDELEEGARKRGRTHDLEEGANSEKARPRSCDRSRRRTRGRSKGPEVRKCPRSLADLAAGELEFTDDKVRVGLMFLLLDIFVEWGTAEEG